MAIELKVPSMVCEGCVETVTKAIKTHEPEAEVDIDLTSKKVTVNTEASEESIKQIIVATGHEVA
ncbi:Heavy metal transport/detoxification protein [Stanieria cyanosphaera PCC 7437]|uniref:Heavy metal transport/detoxification protein n=1 Tax=Stanieria cyanosphaera (strain ATCC 29371 / PCC 7437) TaxID=111780 RepID=K9XXZ0_STAC7|nr:heavy-metal-associated domain-containing protein [Stanieria cyanosphaera]AFZ36924.1 Heavy metal transport/detoxification protein [Stanieria cyanosphaera PCC 7437]